MSNKTLINSWSRQDCLIYLGLGDADKSDLETLQKKSRKKFLKLSQEKEQIESLEELFRVEKEIISRQRCHRLVNNATQTNNNDYCGIAISGGGIRSASFGLGILQALCNRKKLKYFDYMSAVSGGGYIASCLTWFNKNNRPNNDSVNSDCELFNTNAKINQKEEGETKKTGYNEKTLLNYLRQNGKYLTPTKDLNGLALVGAITGNSLVTATVYFSLFIVMFWVFQLLNFYTEFDTSRLGILNSIIWFEKTTGPKLFLFLLICILLILHISSALNTKKVGKGNSNIQKALAQKYRNRWMLQKLIGKTAFIIVIIGILVTLPDVWVSIEYIISFYFHSENDSKSVTDLEFASIGVVLGVIGAIYHFFRQNVPAKKYSFVTDIRIILTAIVLIYSVLLVSWKISADYPSLFTLLLKSGDSDIANRWIAAIPCLFVLLGLFVNINYFGIRQMYRDRLMEIFLPDMSNFDKNTKEVFQWHPAKKADQADIHDMCSIEDFGPYLILNANAVLNNSNNAKYRNRGGDNYMLSSQFIGCSATGWFPVCQLKYPAPLTLGAAMSISGAAVNPHAGVGGKGFTRGRLVSMILGFLNIRLGYWIENPVLNPSLIDNQITKIIAKVLNAPNLIYPGFSRGILGFGGDENNDYIELTDGGHFDNTGLYELFRRKLKVILLSQAGADPDFTVDDIGNAIQRARTDFGIDIYFVPGYGLNEIVPGSGKMEGLSSKIEISKNPYAVALIKYATDEFGVLIIIKTVLTPGLSGDLYSYKLSNTTFPNQSTTDQFFTEDQFEAYRELGFQLCYKMLSEEFGINLSSLNDLVEIVRLKTLLVYKPNIDDWTEVDCVGFLQDEVNKISEYNPKTSDNIMLLRTACKEKIR